MNYVLEILKRELVKEKSYEAQHRAKLAKELHISDRQMYELSVRRAEERIPQLEKAIADLNQQPPGLRDG